MTTQLPLFPTTPPAPASLQAWWVSTPAFTCLVEIDAAGQIRHTAPLLRIWRGQAFAQLQAWCRKRWPAGCRWERLPARGEAQP